MQCWKHTEKIAPRTRFRINIISITRGENQIDLPEGNESIYPYDKITAVGTDEDLKRFGQELDTRRETGKNPDKRLPMGIRNICLETTSKLNNKRLSDIKTKAFIVLGLERDKQITMNPGPDTLFQAGDIIWIVGKKGAEQEII